MTSPTYLPVNSLAFQIPENIVFSRDYDQFLLQITDLFQKIARASNAKDIGIYPLTEILNGHQFFDTANAQSYKRVYRKAFSFGAIAAGATLNIAHGSTFVQLTRAYGTCITNVVDYRPIPYVSVAATNAQIELQVTGANIVIINGAASPNITSGIIVLEYLKN